MDTPTSTPSIIPPTERPPDEEPKRERQADGRRLSMARVLTFVALVILLLTAAGVIFILPKVVEQHRSVESSAAEPAVPAKTTPKSTVNTAKRDAEKQAAEYALGDSLRAKAARDVEGANRWAVDDYAAMLKRLAEGDAHFQAGEFGSARDVYREVTTGMQAIGSSKQMRLEAALGEGAESLEAGNGDPATNAFRIALAIDPDNEQAKLGLARSLHIGEVFAMMGAAEALVAKEQWDVAADRYRAIINLDGAYTPARDALARVEQALSNRAFDGAMSRALAALETGDTGATRAALKDARGLRPNSPAVADVVRRLSSIVLSRRLRTLEGEAAGLVAEERWREVMNVYDTALGLDGSAGFATRGRAHSQSRISLHERLDLYLTQPSRLQSAGPLAEARGLLATITRPLSNEPKLAAKVSQLQQLVASADTLVSVKLRSDTLTNVTIYKVGSLGSFSERVLELRPGRYTVVGTRAGYRDVRKEFAVAARSGLTVDVRCEERI